MFNWISPRAQWLAGMVGLVDFVASVGLTTVFFVLLMRWLPARRRQLAHIVVGSVVGALLFALGKVAISKQTPLNRRLSLRLRPVAAGCRAACRHT